ncbi:MAG: hypothetical protein WBV73_03385 [Phormidium sp.]
MVIRFAEEQVCRWPDSCCKTIATVVSQVLGNSLPSEFTNVPDLPPIDRWTEAQAQLMAEHNYRNRYLK